MSLDAELCDEKKTYRIHKMARVRYGLVKRENTYCRKTVINRTIIWIIFIMTFGALKNELSGNRLCVQNTYQTP